MEKIHIYDMMLSLKEISLRKVAILLWCQSDIFASLDLYSVEYKVKKNIQKLELPAMLLQELNNLVKPIGLKITDWKAFHESFLKIGKINIFYMLEHLTWTSLGTINYRKTAEIVIYHEMLDIVKRYRLACLYCLEEYIPVLWVQLSKERKKYFYKGKEFVDPQLEFCWPYFLKGKEYLMDWTFRYYPFGETSTYEQYAFEVSAYKGNIAAAEYFFPKIPCEERVNSLNEMALKVCFHRHDDSDYQLGSKIDYFPDQNISDVFCYLTFLMKPEQQVEIFKKEPSKAMACLLDWPWLNIFMEIVERFWNYLDADEYVSLINYIVFKIESDNNLNELFRDFFLRGSSDFIKQFVEKESRCGYVLRVLIKALDKVTIKVIFRKLDNIDRKKLVSSRHIFKLFYNSIMMGKKHFVELCLEEATLSSADKKELKETYLRFLPDVYESNENLSSVLLKRRERGWKLFLRFFD